MLETARGAAGRGASPSDTGSSARRTAILLWCTVSFVASPGDPRKQYKSMVAVWRAQATNPPAVNLGLVCTMDAANCNAGIKPQSEVPFELQIAAVDLALQAIQAQQLVREKLVHMLRQHTHRRQLQLSIDMAGGCGADGDVAAGYQDGGAVAAACHHHNALLESDDESDFLDAAVFTNGASSYDSCKSPAEITAPPPEVVARAKSKVYDAIDVEVRQLTVLVDRLEARDVLPAREDDEVAMALCEAICNLRDILGRLLHLARFYCCYGSSMQGGKTVWQRQRQRQKEEQDQRSPGGTPAGRTPHSHRVQRPEAGPPRELGPRPVCASQPS